MKTIDIALSDCNERDVAIDFYIDRKSMFVYDPELYHWYEFEKGTYYNRKQLPVRLKLCLRTDYIKKCERILLGYETERLDLEKMRLESGAFEIYEEITIVRSRIKKVSNLINKLKTTHFENRIIEELKLLYVRYLSPETFERLIQTNCPVEQWIYVNLRHHPEGKRMSASEIYEYYTGCYVDISIFGRKLNKCFKPSERSGNKRFYNGVDIFEDLI